MKVPNFELLSSGNWERTDSYKFLTEIRFKEHAVVPRMEANFAVRFPNLIRLSKLPDEESCGRNIAYFLQFYSGQSKKMVFTSYSPDRELEYPKLIQSVTNAVGNMDMSVDMLSDSAGVWFKRGSVECLAKKD